MKLYYITGAIFLALIVFQIHFIAVTFLEEPRVWPDEAYYADIALNIVKRGHASTDIWGGMMPGAADRALWYPPVFFYSVAYWLKLVGFSIEKQRLLSLIVGGGFLFVFYHFTKLLIRRTVQMGSISSAWLAATAGIALATDQIFVRAVKISRPEIVVLLFCIVSAYLLLRSDDAGSNAKRRTLFMVGCGLCASAAVLTHLIGVFVPVAILIYIVLLAVCRGGRVRMFVYFTSAFAVPVVMWLASVFPDLDILREQLGLVRHYFLTIPTSIFEKLRYESLGMMAIYCLYILGSIVFVVFSFIKQKWEYVLLTSIIVFSWVAALRGQSNWYDVYPIPFVYCALVLLVASLYTTAARQRCWPLVSVQVQIPIVQQIVQKKLSTPAALRILFLIVVVSVPASLVILNVRAHYTLLEDTKKRELTYDAYTQRILHYISADKTVFLSAIPDPYFGFKARNIDTNVYQFPVVRTGAKEYLNILNNSDYVVYNGLYESRFFGNMLQSYIQRNSKHTYSVPEPGHELDETKVIELKPRDQRVPPW